MPRHIGIVGCSAEGAALCYRTICLEGAALLARQDAHPEVSLHTNSLGDYVPYLESGDLAGVARLMLDSAHKLARAGAEFLICPDNTIHEALPLVLPQSPLPWLHIAEVVATEACRRGFRRVGVTGTAWLVRSDVYPGKLAAVGIECVRPADADLEQTSRIIMDELVRGVFRSESTATLEGVLQRLAAAGCDAVVLGCTELPLVLGDHNSPVPTLDSTRLLARAALRHALT
ncbi:MAG TPA: amino acid racemase [Steroidobacteraceae bacterium]|nr:amino acid racemase [Steroidobacteraceae bacterium]